MWPAEKIGHAASSSRLRFFAIRCGSPPVPEAYGPAIRISMGVAGGVVRGDVVMRIDYA
jgi:hypothetical protein